MLGGYAGKILRVDLTKNSIEEEKIPEETLRAYLGGSGLGARILYDETDSDTDPLGPENLLIFMTGPTEGTRMPNAGRYEVITRSPLTGSYGEANSGGKWGVRLKKAGFDGLVIKGCAEKPVYLYLKDGKASIEDASEIWGKDTFEVDHYLKDKYGKMQTNCCIGVSGEKLSRISCIMNDGEDGRAAGRCGVGAVMGSKRLKAICVEGTMATPVVHEKEFNESVKKWMPIIMKNMEGMREGGTSGAVPFIEEIGDLPVKNWQEGSFNTDKLEMNYINTHFLSGRYGCANCTIRCGRVVDVKEGPYKTDGNVAGPEYETVGLFGPNCLIDDLGAITKANSICNQYGLDTIGAANAVSFAMEAYDRGLLTKEMLGCEARWGNCEDMIAVLEKIAKREDFGDVLAEGTRIAAEKLGGNSIEFSVQTRGMEFPAHDPRYADSIGLQYAVSPRGACHLTANCHGEEYGGMYGGYGFNDKGVVKLKNHSTEHKVDMNIELEHIMCLCDSMSCCKFLLGALGNQGCELFVSWLSDITGWDMNREELLTIGERIFNLKRMYLVRDGQSRKDDKLPPRMKKRRMTGGSAFNIPDVDGMLDEYYEKRGWDEFGIPKKETLQRLGLAK